MTSNGTNYNNNNISIAVLSAVYNRSYEIPVFKTYVVKSGDLDKYLGVYSSTQISLKITITKENNTLIAQATGQSSFPLEAAECFSSWNACETEWKFCRHVDLD